MRYVIGMQDPRIKAPCYGFLGPTRIYTYEYTYIHMHIIYPNIPLMPR